jgi:hypothetical protein
MRTVVYERIDLYDRIPDGACADGVQPVTADPHPAASTQEEGRCEIKADRAPLFIISEVHWIYVTLTPTSE